MSELTGVDTPAPAEGFLGPGHIAVEVLRPNDPKASDPFVLVADDRIDFAPGMSIGEAHPHAGLETLTLVLDGSVLDRDEDTTRLLGPAGGTLDIPLPTDALPPGDYRLRVSVALEGSREERELTFHIIGSTTARVR